MQNKIKIFPIKKGEQWNSKEEVIEWLENCKKNGETFFNLFSTRFKTLAKGTKCILRFEDSLIAEFVLIEDMVSREQLLNYGKILTTNERDLDFKNRVYYSKESLEYYSPYISMQRFLDITGKKFCGQAYYNLNMEQYNHLKTK